MNHYSDQGSSKNNPAIPLRIFTPQEYKILKAAADRIILQASDRFKMDVAQQIDSTLTRVPEHIGQEFKLLLLVFEYGAPLLGFIPKKFTGMSLEEKDRYLAGWEQSELAFKRMGFQAIKRTSLAVFYGSNLSWSGIGYRGPWLDKGYPSDYPGKGIQHGH